MLVEINGGRGNVGGPNILVETVVARLQSLFECESVAEASSIHVDHEFSGIWLRSFVVVESGGRAIETSGSSLGWEQLESVVAFRRDLQGNCNQNYEDSSHQ